MVGGGGEGTQSDLPGEMKTENNSTFKFYPQNCKVYLRVPYNYKCFEGNYQTCSAAHKHMKYLAQDAEGKRTLSRRSKRMCGERGSRGEGTGGDEGRRSRIK